MILSKITAQIFKKSQKEHLKKYLMAKIFKKKLKLVKRAMLWLKSNRRKSSNYLLKEKQKSLANKKQKNKIIIQLKIQM